MSEVLLLVAQVLLSLSPMLRILMNTAVCAHPAAAL
jgi:hypothetical protein